MEELAWRYVARGDVASAERLFSTLGATFSYSGGAGSVNSFERFRRLCRVVGDPYAVPAPQRCEDAVEALLEERFPLEAFFTNSLASNSVTLNKWILLVHPDKNSHSGARQAFLRLTSMKEELVQRGLLSEMGIQSSHPAPAGREIIQTRLPPVINEQRLEREQYRREKRLDTLVNHLRRPRVKLSCDLTVSSFEGTLRSLDFAGAQREDIAEGTESGVTSSLNSTLDEASLTRTVIMEGLAQSRCSDSIIQSMSRAMASDTTLLAGDLHLSDRNGYLSSSVKNSAASTGCGPTSASDDVPQGVNSMLTRHRIVLRRPPTLDEWRLERGRDAVVPGASCDAERGVLVPPATRSCGLPTATAALPILRSPTPSEGSGGSRGGRGASRSCSRGMVPMPRQSPQHSRMKEFVIPI